MAGLTGGAATRSWSDWQASRPYSVGVEEEVMLVDANADWALALGVDEILRALPPALASHVATETQDSVLELATDPHETFAQAADQASRLRAQLRRELRPMGLRAAGAGTHPCTVWTDVRISEGSRQQEVYGAMRELARREPTFGLHVHIGVRDPDAAITLYNRMRSHLPLLLALSANSPYWQGRDTGLASTRTPIFQAFPRVGTPRAFTSYEDYVETVDRLLRCEAFPEPTYLWWDVRPQPRFGTIEIRIMDVQPTSAFTAALVALVQAIAGLELEEGYHVDQLAGNMEVLVENRFVASRDGMDAVLIDPVSETRVPARVALARLIEAARPHAQSLGCEDGLEGATELARANGAARQRAVFERAGELTSIVSWLADEF